MFFTGLETGNFNSLRNIDKIKLKIKENNLQVIGISKIGSTLVSREFKPHEHHVAQSLVEFLLRKRRTHEKKSCRENVNGLSTASADASC